MGSILPACPFVTRGNLTLYEILYVSTLSDDLPVTVVSQIAEQARIRNRVHGVTGMLVFDGVQFCQQFEGEQAAVQKLFELIRRDPRHVQLKLLHAGALSKRRFKHFAMGLATLGDDEDLLYRLSHLEGQAAIKDFLTAIPKLDKKAVLHA